MNEASLIPSGPSRPPYKRHLNVLPAFGLPLKTPLTKLLAWTMAKKKKVDNEYRRFQERWEAEYLFCAFKQKPMCLICQDSVAFFKEYNIRRHFETKHHSQYGNMDMSQRLQKVKELKSKLQQQQCMFTRINSESEGAVKASFIVAEEIARACKPFRGRVY